MNLIEEIYSGDSYELNEGYDKERARKQALKKVIPLVVKNELTDRQQTCIRFKYDSGKNQKEIAKIIKVSQPTVSRHIENAERVLNRELKYCYFAVSVALDSYEG